MYYSYEPYMSHSGRANMEWYKHKFGPQQSPSHYALGADTQGFIQKVGNAFKSVGAAYGGFKDWREANKFKKLASKYWSADKDDPVWYEWIKQRKKEKYDELMAAYQDSINHMNAQFNTARGLSKVGGMLITVAQKIYGGFSTIKKFVNGLFGGIKLKKQKTNTSSKQFKAAMAVAEQVANTTKQNVVNTAKNISNTLSPSAMKQRQADAAAREANAQKQINKGIAVDYWRSMLAEAKKNKTSKKSNKSTLTAAEQRELNAQNRINQSISNDYASTQRSNKKSTKNYRQTTLPNGQVIRWQSNAAPGMR